ncbi:integrin-linked kinase-associated serine/threonine phosphatase 2C-like [Octopus vulgaris]|uniref:Integrin-linked kinase-associated serine/threonine phosphatase 2C-like n=1 Tax=Octopus vulgaris TaxID=6645 RepID=A0AA36APG5_OCTVU|nr:integrin-linked kinase-associated serine/threonine phosphatase 2C-like [Octopus vulgaris]
MDLFGDLPEPGHQSNSVENKECNNEEKQTKTTNGAATKRKATHSSADEVSATAAKQRQSINYYLKGYVREMKGERDEMQDAHIVLDGFATEFDDLHPSVCRLAVYGVFDGHGGSRAACFASKHLYKNLRTVFPKGDIKQVEKEIKRSFIEAYKQTDRDYLTVAAKNKPAWKDGSTATVVLAINDTLYISNLGDSKAILCRYKENTQQYVAVPLTTEHHPTVYEERMRIQKAGGHVKDGRVMGTLEISRSLGDGQYKNHGVICVPDVRKCQLTDNDRFFIIACDGLWKSLTPEECIQFVCNVLEDKSIEGNGTKGTEEMRYEAACQRLVNEAILRLTADNVTVVLVSISHFTKFNSNFCCP